MTGDPVQAACAHLLPLTQCLFRSRKHQTNIGVWGFPSSEDRYGTQIAFHYLGEDCALTDETRGREINCVGS